MTLAEQCLPAGPMEALTKYLCLLAGLLAASVHAGQWFELAPRDSGPHATLVEVDLGTVRLRDGSGEAVIRVSHELPQEHPSGFIYRSFVATAQIECRQQTVGLVSAAYFAQPGAEGPRLGSDSAARQAGLPPRLLQTIPLHARRALLKAACSATPSS
jgi:hypothetical protein